MAVRPFFEYELVKQWRYKSVKFEHSVKNDKTEVVAVSAISQASNASSERLLIFSVKDDIKYIDLQGRFISASVTPCVVGLERVMGIEPTSKAWEAFVLPLNYTRKIRGAALGVTLPSQYLNIAVTRPLQRLASF